MNERMGRNPFETERRDTETQPVASEVLKTVDRTQESDPMSPIQNKKTSETEASVGAQLRSPTQKNTHRVRDEDLPSLKEWIFQELPKEARNFGGRVARLAKDLVKKK